MSSTARQAKGGERPGEKLLAVAEIVFEPVAVVFQDFEALETDPVDERGVLAVADRDRLDPAVMA